MTQQITKHNNCLETYKLIIKTTRFWLLELITYMYYTHLTTVQPLLLF